MLLFKVEILLRNQVEHSNSLRKPYLYSTKDSTFRIEPDPNKSTAWTAVSNPIYNEVRVVPNELKSNPVNPTHELGFLKPKIHYKFSVQKFEVNVQNTRGKLTDCFEFHK